jgi:SAM-dependent methyltransferase
MTGEAAITDLYSSRPDLYDLMHADVQGDVRFLEDLAAGLGDRATILELGCGTGRLLLPLLRAGARVVGLDRNPTMLEVARRRVAVYGDRAQLVEGDMRRFSLAERFDLVVVGLNTFMHLLASREQLDCLEAIKAHTRPGGTLVLDLANPHAVVRDTPVGVLQHRLTKAADKSAATVTLCSSLAVALALQLTHSTLFFDETDEKGSLRRTTAEVTLRLTYQFELELLLGRTGFAIKHLYGDYEQAPYDDDTERLLCLATAFA